MAQRSRLGIDPAAAIRRPYSTLTPRGRYTPPQLPTAITPPLSPACLIGNYPRPPLTGTLPYVIGFKTDPRTLCDCGRSCTLYERLIGRGCRLNPSFVPLDWMSCDSEHCVIWIVLNCVMLRFQTCLSTWREYPASFVSHVRTFVPYATPGGYWYEIAITS